MKHSDIADLCMKAGIFDQEILDAFIHVNDRMYKIMAAQEATDSAFIEFNEENIKKARAIAAFLFNMSCEFHAIYAGMGNLTNTQKKQMVGMAAAAMQFILDQHIGGECTVEEMEEALSKTSKEDVS